MKKENYALVVSILCIIAAIGMTMYFFGPLTNKMPSTEIAQKQPSVMEWYKATQPSEPIKFDNGVARKVIKVEFIIEEDCGNNHCVSYVKEENGPHFQLGSMISPRNFNVNQSYNCELNPDDSGFTAAIIVSCK